MPATKVVKEEGRKKHKSKIPTEKFDRVNLKTETIKAKFIKL
jgi:hypothetical protein